MFKKIIAKQKAVSKSKKRAKLLIKLAEAEKNGNLQAIKKILEELDQIV